MGFARTVARNVFSNAAGFFVNAAVAFLLTPYVAIKLGSAGWGLWALLVACTGYYGLLDLGIRSAVGQYVTRYFAKGDTDGVNRTLSTSFGLMVATGAALLLLTPGVVWAAPHVIEADEIPPATMRIAFAIVGIGTAINFPLLIFQSATYARQRFDIATGIAIVERLLSAGLYLWVLDAGYGLIGVAIVNTAVTTSANLARLRIAFALLPGLRITRSGFRRESVRELYGYSVFSVLINAADQVSIHSASIVLGIVISSTAVAHYNAGALPVSYFVGLISTIAWTLTPLATARDSLGDTATVRQLWLSGSRMIFTFASVIAGGILLMGQEFLQLWMEPTYTDGSEFVSSAWIAGALALSGLVRAATTTGRQICFGMREVRFLARISFIEAGVNIALCTVLAFTHGILGVAVAILVTTTVVQLGAMPIFLSRRLDVPLIAFVRSVPWAGFAVLATMFATAWALGNALYATDWALFVVKAAVLSTPAAIVGVVLGTTRAEKERLRAQLQRLRPSRRSA